MNYKKEIINELNNYLIPDLSEIVVDYVGKKEYHFIKAEIFNDIWSIVKRHREVKNDISKALSLQLEFEEILDKYIKNQIPNFKPTKKQLKRDVIYLRKLFIKEMTKQMKYNFKIPVGGQIKCGKCGKIKRLEYMIFVNKYKYSYICNKC